MHSASLPYWGMYRMMEPCWPRRLVALDVVDSSMKQFISLEEYYSNFGWNGNLHVPTKNVMPQKDAALQYIIAFAAGHHIAHTSLQNWITLGQVGLALTCLHYLLTQSLPTNPLPQNFAQFLDEFY
jgi:hypothetical protein